MNISWTARPAPQHSPTHSAVVGPQREVPEQYKLSAYPHGCSLCLSSLWGLGRMEGLPLPHRLRSLPQLHILLTNSHRTVLGWAGGPGPPTYLASWLREGWDHRVGPTFPPLISGDGESQRREGQEAALSPQ